MKIDLHTHTSFSPDSKEEPEVMVSTAASLGCSVYGITEHIDFDYVVCKIDSVQTDIQAYINKICELKTEVSNMLLLTGAEFAYHKEAEALYRDTLTKYNFDYIINSVHVTDGKDCYFLPYFEGKEKDYAYRRYLETVLESVDAGYDYQIVGHIGYVARHAPYEDKKLYYKDFAKLIDEILFRIIQKNKVLEVNTNVKNCGFLTLPSFEILERYYELGGRKITYGSDAHSKERILENYDLVINKLKEIGFKRLTYFNNKEAFTVEI